MKRYFLLSMVGLCLLFFAISPVFAGDPACSFCEFINISKGDPGSPGANGLNGINGTNGTAGLNASILINATFTVDSGTSASVINIGNDTNAIFDFLIPRGYNGTSGTNGTNTTLAINYTFTGLPGTNANVTNIGNTTNAIYDITIPQGLTGDTGATGATGGTGGQVLYFRHDAAADPITYERLVDIPSGSAEDDESVTVNTGLGDVIVDSYVTDIGYPAITELPAGLWRFRTFHYVSGASGNTYAVFKVYNRTSAGTETLLFTATSDDINALAVDEYLTSYVQTVSYPVSLTDRIVVKVYGQSSHSSNIIFHFVYEGSTHTSHIQTTLESAPATSLSFDVIAGEALYKGEAVYISGASDGAPVVSGADNTNTAKSRVVGLMMANTASGSRGQVRRAGVLTAVDTRSTSININPLGQTWSAGDLLFATTGGGLTNVRPTSGRSVKSGYSLLGSNENDVLMAYPMENPVWVTAASSEDVITRLGDSVGVNKLSIRDYTNTEVGYINSYGNATFNGVDNNNYRLTNVRDPVALQDAATKNYVDTHSSSGTNLSAIYPVGVVMITSDNVSPATKLGWGNWSSMGTGYFVLVSG